MLGIIASSAAAKLGEALGLESRQIDTPYGTVVVRVGSVGGREIACLARHGETRTVPPHNVNFRGNVWALAELGCTGVLATNAVGALGASLRPGALCVPSQILDFTAGRPRTFFDDELVAVDFTDPYCPRLSQTLVEVVKGIGEEAVVGGVYACMEGPRFETAAEIKMLRMLGADIVGMTAMPEAVLAREKGMCYTSLCVVTNLAAGVEGHHPTASEVGEEMERRWRVLEDIVKQFAVAYTDDPECACHRAFR